MAMPHVHPRRITVLTAAAAVGVMSLLVPQAARAVTPAAGGSPARPVHPRSGSALGMRLLGKPGTWTKLSGDTKLGLSEAGLVRSKDGRLHVAWPVDVSGKFGIRYATIAKTGKLLKTGTVLSGWDGLQTTPKLVPDGNGVRLVFNGGLDNTSNPFSRGARYTATSTDGSSWTMVNGSLSSQTVFNSSLAATTEADGTPVTSEGLNATLFYHVGIDPAVPSNTADKTITDSSAYFLGNAALVRDTKTNAVYEGWYQSGNTKGTGFYVKQILPTVAAAKEAPHSNDQGLPDSEPRQGVALAARAGGGVYLAFCQPSKVLQCAKIDLWKIGTTTVRVVPGSATGHVTHVSLSAGPRGRMVVGWFDTSANQIRVTRTNTKATAFGPVRRVKSPIKASDLVGVTGLFTESSSGRIDVVALAQRFSGGAPVSWFHTQVLAGLTVHASPGSVTHGHRTKVTFHVTDAGQAVSGATVTFLGHHVKTNSRGNASVTVGAGTAKGHYKATAKKAGYFRATVTVTVH